jgi:16S rRNA G1207 methylase RsmC
LVVDDAFGAITCCLAHRARAWGDSEIGRLALAANLDRNGLSDVPWTPMTRPPQGADVAAVLVRLPKSLRRLQYLLSVLAPTLAGGTPVLFGARSKHVQKTALRAVEAAIGPAATTRAAHRSRLILAVRDERAPPTASLCGVFGETGVDRGSALLLSALPPLADGARVIDLGCGAGVLGLGAAANPTVSLLFCDESHLAVAAARQAFEDAARSNPARFVVQDVLTLEADSSADLVLCNPPFHQGRTISRRVAARMFAEAARVLRPGGRLLVVGNRHLNYHQRLPRHFERTRVVRSNPRFVVLEAVRGPQG